jgi:hypothetical protein
VSRVAGMQAELKAAAKEAAELRATLAVIKAEVRGSEIGCTFRLQSTL